MSVTRRISGMPLVRFLATPVLAGVILTILAPLGTHNYSLAGRAIYWVGLCVTGGIGAMFAELCIARCKTQPTTIVQTLWRSLGATLAVLPFVIFGMGMTTVLTISLAFFYVWVIAIVITGVSELISHRRSAPVSQIERPPLMDRLPLKLQDADLYAAVSEDHYLRIYTSNGNHMILMRLGDVPDLALPLDGLSPHRSWWVARNGVADIGRQDGKLIITLKDGTAVPVSRAGAKRVKEAGWLP